MAKGLHRRDARRDESERPIIKALRQCGFSVQQLSAKGCGDLLLGKGGLTRVAEVKTGDEPLRPEQVDWWGDWKGNALIVLRSTEDVARLSRCWQVL